MVCWTHILFFDRSASEEGNPSQSVQEDGRTDYFSGTVPILSYPYNNNLAKKELLGPTLLSTQGDMVL